LARQALTQNQRQTASTRERGIADFFESDTLSG
jgi:hypothetical protein